MEAYHSGEKEVQERAGVRHFSERVAGAIRQEIPEIAQSFLAVQSYVFMSMLDSKRQPWATLLFGAAGFLSAPDEKTVEIRASLISGDSLEGCLKPGLPVGLLAIDFSTRKRVKIKGKILQATDPIQIKVERVYSLCPKYIQKRIVTDKTSFSPKTGSAKAAQGKNLTKPQQQLIASADTFFIATHHPETGADVSHRGGLPGFVEVINDSTLRFPDYIGNNMFNTLGNIIVNPHAGLLFIDFETGSLLQMTGQAEIGWSESERQKFTEAHRIVSFRVEKVSEISEACPLHWKLVDTSPFNPSPPRTS